MDTDHTIVPWFEKKDEPNVYHKQLHARFIKNNHIYSLKKIPSVHMYNLGIYVYIYRMHDGGNVFDTVPNTYPVHHKEDRIVLLLLIYVIH